MVHLDVVEIVQLAVVINAQDLLVRRRLLHAQNAEANAPVQVRLEQPAIIRVMICKEGLLWLENITYQWLRTIQI